MSEAQETVTFKVTVSFEQIGNLLINMTRNLFLQHRLQNICNPAVQTFI